MPVKMFSINTCATVLKHVPWKRGIKTNNSVACFLFLRGQHCNVLQPKRLFMKIKIQATLRVRN